MLRFLLIERENVATILVGFMRSSSDGVDTYFVWLMKRMASLVELLALNLADRYWYTFQHLREHIHPHCLIRKLGPVPYE